VLGRAQTAGTLETRYCNLTIELLVTSFQAIYSLLSPLSL
jgi:hypothetical protein